MYLQPSTIPKITKDYRLALSDYDENQGHLEIYAIRYERMDEHVPSASGWFPTEQRYDVPISSGVETPKPWGPYFLGVYDLANIRLSGALYVRKVATSIDPNIFALLPADRPEDIPLIGWPKELKVSPVPDWEKKLAAMKKQYMREKKADAPEKSPGEKKHEGEITEVDPSKRESQVDIGNQPDDKHVEVRERFDGGDDEEGEVEEDEESSEEGEGEESEDDDMGSYLPKEFRPRIDIPEESL